MTTKLNEEKALFRFGFVFQLLTSLALMPSDCVGQQSENASLHSWASRCFPAPRPPPHYPIANISQHSEQTIGPLKINWKANIPVPLVGRRGGRQGDEGNF